MSTAELIRPASASRIPRLRARLLGSELRLVLRRRRNLGMLAALAAVPILLGVIVRITSGPDAGQGPPLLDQVAHNGFFLGLAALVFALPLFLPMVLGVVAGDSVAGEANLGTLRNLLVVPAGRTRLLLVKAAGIAVYALAAVAIILASGLITGAVLFPSGEVVTLSGTVIGYGEALGRALLIAGYMAVMMSALGAIGLFFSTLTEVPMGAMAATVTAAIASQILDAVPQVEAIHPVLPTHWWETFVDLIRDPMYLADVGPGLAVAAGYIAVFMTAAWARITTKDVT
ncbi:MAG TPA: ABC transporter permease [Jiangellaceae bacterium]